MNIDLDKIKKLPPDVRKDFMKMYLKFGEKKKISHIQSDFLSFVKHMWPEFIEGPHHKIIAKKFNNMSTGKVKRLIVNLQQNTLRLVQFPSDLLLVNLL